MIGGRIEKIGVDLVVKRARSRAYAAADMRGLSEEMEAELSRQKDQMWDNNGVVPGRYGEGTRRWADNAPSTIRKKGFNKPLHSGRQRHASGIYRGYRITSWYQTRQGGGRAMMRIRFESTATRGGFDYAKANNAGTRTAPARPHQGWTAGRQKLLLKVAQERTLLQRGWRGTA